jgi:hypothetical protein
VGESPRKWLYRTHIILFAAEPTIGQCKQRFASKPKPRKFLKVLQSNAFKNFLVARLIGNCWKL